MQLPEIIIERHKKILRFDVLVVIAVYLAVVFINGIWIQRDTVPLTWDQAGYMAVAGSLGNSLTHGNINTFIYHFLHHDPWNQRPAVAMVVGALAYILTGPNPHRIEWLSNAVWLAVLSFSTYRIGTWFRTRGVGIIASFLTITMPAIAGASRDFGVDLPLTAMVAYVIWRLISTNGFISRKNSLLFGFYLFLGMCTKETFVLYVLVPVVAYFGQAAWRSERMTVRVQNFILSVLGAGVLTSLVYIPILPAMVQNAVNNVGTKVGQYYSRGVGPNSIKYYIVYIKDLINTDGSFVYIAIPIIVALVWWVIKLTMPDRSLRRTGESKMPIMSKVTLLLLWIAVPTAFLTLFVVDTNFRFIMPVLPGIAVVLADLVVNINDKFIRGAGVALLVLVGMVQFIAQSFGVSWLPGELTYGGITLWNQWVTHDPTVKIGKPIRQNWNVPSVLRLIDDNAGDYPRPVWIGMLVDTPYLNENVIKEYAFLNNMPFNAIGIGDGVRNVHYKKHINDVYFIITKSGSLGPSFASVYFPQAIKYVHELVQQGVYQKIGTLHEPDGSTLDVYRRVIH